MPKLHSSQNKIFYPTEKKNQENFTFSNLRFHIFIPNKKIPLTFEKQSYENSASYFIRYQFIVFIEFSFSPRTDKIPTFITAFKDMTWYRCMRRSIYLIKPFQSPHLCCKQELYWPLRTVTFFNLSITDREQKRAVNTSLVWNHTAEASTLAFNNNISS